MGKLFSAVAVVSKFSLGRELGRSVGSTIASAIEMMPSEKKFTLSAIARLKEYLCRRQCHRRAGSPFLSTQAAILLGKDPTQYG